MLGFALAGCDQHRPKLKPMPVDFAPDFAGFGPSSANISWAARSCCRPCGLRIVSSGLNLSPLCCDGDVAGPLGAQGHGSSGQSSLSGRKF